MPEIKLFKVVGVDGYAYHGGRAEWSLSIAGLPGAWMPEIPTVLPDQEGYHLCREQDLIYWLGPQIYVAEADAQGDSAPSYNGVSVSSARLLTLLPWNSGQARLFLADCVQRIIPYCVRTQGPGEELQEAVEVARAFVNEKRNCWADVARVKKRLRAVIKGDTVATTYHAVNAAIGLLSDWPNGDHGRKTARHAAQVVAINEAKMAAAEVEYAPAYPGKGAVRDACRDAVMNVARQVEVDWQTERLLEYLCAG